MPIMFLLRRSGDIVDVCEAAFRVFLLDNPERLEIPEGDVCTFTRSDGDGRTLYAAADGIAEITPPKSWIGKSLRALNIRGKYHVNVLALKDAASEKVNITPGAEDVIREGDTVMIIGHNEDLALLQRS